MSNFFTATKQVTRIDYFGNPYTTTVIDNNKDLAELWKRFTETQLQAEKYAAEHKIYTQGGPVIPDGYVDREVDKQIYEHEKS